MVSSAAAETVLPSRVNTTGFAISEVLAEMPQQVTDGVGRGLAEPADRCVARHRFEVADRRLVERALLLEQRHHLAGALAARRALAAAFVPEESEQVERHRLGAVAVREHHDRMRADEGALPGTFAADRKTVVWGNGVSV